MSKKFLAIACLALAVVGGLFGYMAWKESQSALPPGIASGNGRVEAKQVDIAAKESLRVKEIMVKEGDLVEKGQVLVAMDTSTLESQLNEASASYAASQERVAAANSGLVRQKSLAETSRIEEKRMAELLESNSVSESEYLRTKTAAEASEASVGEASAQLRTAEQQVKFAEANMRTIQTRIDDATLKAPVRGRVLYKLAENGEVLGAGAKALTLVNLEDVYMEIFLPSQIASQLKVGSEARLTADHTPDRCVAGVVSFVSPEAQFTPKQVETKSERDKLMFRVKIQVPEEMVKAYIERIKTGVRGVGYVRYDDKAEWPAFLASPIGPPPPLPTEEPKVGPSDADSTGADEAGAVETGAVETGANETGSSSSSATPP
ncbi:MAG: efflux RND transporter periplasmic adaptor subunit [Pirellula sp.]|nr:efflux RND transporter periplasmic adaptor subunit [Pirellula sp.]